LPFLCQITNFQDIISLIPVLINILQKKSRHSGRGSHEKNGKFAFYQIQADYLINGEIPSYGIEINLTHLDSFLKFG